MKFGWLRRKRFWLLAFGTVLLIGLGSRLPLAEWFTQLRQWLPTLGPWAVPAFVLLYLMATVLGLPNILLILVAGSLFGLVKGIIVASIADTLGAIVCFWVGRTIARERIKRWIGRRPRFSQLDQAVGRKGWKILLLTRLSPLVPSNVLNYGFSCTRVNFWQYSFFSWLGMLPVITLYVYLGSFGAKLLTDGLTPPKLALQTLGLGLAVTAGFYTTRLTQQAMAEPCPAEDSEQEPVAATRD